MGKSGIIARKIAATLSSTGTPSTFLHAAEAVHGDLGVVQTDDVVVALSYSGETEELIRLLESIKRIGAKLLALTGNPASTLGQAADATLSCEVPEEACPLNLAPTASTRLPLRWATLAIFRDERLWHRAVCQPASAGPLGRRLMRVKGGTPATRFRASGSLLMPDVITRCRASVWNGVRRRCRRHFVGVVTDGDLGVADARLRLSIARPRT
jgi:arabinose-5-phosphate isomerase